MTSMKENFTGVLDCITPVNLQQRRQQDLVWFNYPGQLINQVHAAQASKKKINYFS